MADEAQHWIEDMKAAGGRRALDPGTMIIAKGERAILMETCTLYEMRVESTRHYLGTRVKLGNTPIYLGSSKNTSKKVLRPISSGTLALTNHGLQFVGSSRTVRIKAADILAAEPTIDSIVISSSHRAAPLVFSVQNPFTWFLGIKLVTSEEISIQPVLAQLDMSPTKPTDLAVST
jgi:hypothetical protein